jgi:hypothetical protein
MSPDLILVTINKDYNIIASRLESLSSYGFLPYIKGLFSSSDGL